MDEKTNNVPTELGMNSQKYWENRFSTNSWDYYDGDKQSAFFSQVAIEFFPAWLRKDLLEHTWEIADLGCAKGGGSALLARHFPSCKVTGIDFSESAVKAAAQLYPHCIFQQGDLTKKLEPMDVVFCSNVLEHMQAPKELLNHICEAAKQYAILMIPYKDVSDIAEHFFVFNRSFFPLQVGPCYLEFFKVIDCEPMHSPYWPGKQILLVYTNAAYKEQGCLTAHDLYENYQCELEQMHQDLLAQVLALEETNKQQYTNCENLTEQVSCLQKNIFQQNDMYHNEKETLTAEKETLTAEKETLTAEKETLTAEKETLTAEKETLTAEKETLTAEKETLAAEKETLTAEKETLAAEKETLTAEKEALAVELDSVLVSQDKLRQGLEQMECDFNNSQKKTKELQEEMTHLNDSFNVRLNKKIEVITKAKGRSVELLHSKSIKIVHLLARIKYQLIKGSFAEKKLFMKWAFGRFFGYYDGDRRFNPIFKIIDAFETTEVFNVQSSPLPLLTEDTSSALSRHLSEQNAYFAEAIENSNKTNATTLRQRLECRNYHGILIYPHTVYWEPLQTPQQLLLAFAEAGWLCFFCEHPLVENACRAVNDNLYIVYESDMVELFGQENSPEAVVLLTWMGSLAFTNRLKHITMWYHVMDSLDIFPYYGADYLTLHNRAVESAKLVSYVARPLETLVASRKDALYLPNGVNMEHFTQPCTSVPQDMQDILQRGNPIIGYYGYLAEWMDYEMVREVALLRPNYEFVFIGKAIYDTSLIDSLPNVHLLGLKSYCELPAYACHFNIATIPFRITEQMNCVSPIKFYEYCALGKPIVSSFMPELQKHVCDCIACVNNADEFVFYLDAFLNDKVRQSASEVGRSIAVANTWNARMHSASVALVQANKSCVQEIYCKHDVIILAVIDFDFRYQRPQQFAVRFAENGHRVFYVNANHYKPTSVEMIAPNLYVVNIHNAEHTAIHLTDWQNNLDELQNAVADILIQYGVRDAVTVVDYPNWLYLAQYLRDTFGCRMLTDYMDDFTGFLNPAEELVKKNCIQLLQVSDIVVASSQFLYDVATKYNTKVSIIRNGSEHRHFFKAFAVGKEPKEQKIVGYYGAIAEWFDVEKICYMARELPDVRIVLIGEVTAGRKHLEKYTNIELLGEKPYAELPEYLSAFDVCLIPFDTSTDLIKATNPVKFYEYLSAGKKIVTTEIPELMEFRDRYVYMSNDNATFLKYVNLCLEGADTLAAEVDRIAMGKKNDWQKRYEIFSELCVSSAPKVSVIVLTYNNLQLNQLCIESILTKTAYPNYELLLVDNLSSDGTREYLKTLVGTPGVRVILNEENLGFAGGNNIGIAEATGDYIVLLNNDTIVTRGWLTGMVKHFDREASLGMVGAVTNSIGNEAKITVEYHDIASMHAFAFGYTQLHWNERLLTSGILALFCTMIKREVIENCGVLDTQYSVGMFEDDDYAVAVRANGYTLAIAEDVFVHHFEGASFKKLEDSAFRALFEANKKRFEQKWKTKWRPHQLRAGIQWSTNLEIDILGNLVV